MRTYRKAIVLGLGASGHAAARLLAREGADVTVVDSAGEHEISDRAADLRDADVKVFAGCEGPCRGDFQVCVVSPGIRADSAWVEYYKRAGIEVVSELEFGWSRAGCRTLAVTGSNGKSTACKLCAELLVDAGYGVQLCGNYGTPVSEIALAGSGPDWLVVEVSSFQLECVGEFRPDVGVLLNIFPNHLDRHGGMEEYAGLKKKMFGNMHAQCCAVLNEDVLRWFDSGTPPCRKAVFGKSDFVDFRYEPGSVVFSDGARRRVIDLGGTMFDNPTLGLTAAASAAAVMACGAGIGSFRRVLEGFKPLEHRFEFVAEKNGVKFINDSKATNLAAAKAAVEACGGGVRLIAGGRAKGEPFEVLKDALSGAVKAVYLIGESAPVMLEAWSGAVACFACGTMEKALEAAWRDAVPGELILLSPGCASFDQFENYEARGRLFRELVMGLTGKLVEYNEKMEEIS